MGTMMGIIIGSHVAGESTFIPGADINRHHTILTVITNRGNITGADGQVRQLSAEMTCNFWRKGACTAALYLEKGREVHMIGDIRSFTIDTGQVRPDGRKILHRRNELHVRNFWFGADTKKSLVARLMTNIQRLQQSGRMPATLAVDAALAEELIAVQRGPYYDYNPQLAVTTGRYGHAKVFIKGQGWLNPSVATAGTAVPGAIPGAAAPGAAMDDLAILKAKVALMEAEAAAAGAAPGNPAVTPEVMATNAANAAALANAHPASVDPLQ